MSLKGDSQRSYGLLGVVVSLVDSVHAWVHRMTDSPALATKTTTTTTTLGAVASTSVNVYRRGVRGRSGFWFVIIGTTTAVIGVITYFSIKRRRQFHKRRHLLLERRRYEEATALEEGQIPPEHWSLLVDGQFVNPYPGWHDHTLWDVLRWWFGRSNQHRPKSVEEVKQMLPLVTPNFELMYPGGQRCQLQYPVTITWLGQSTCLVQLDGINILTDPIFSQCTVNNYLGPRRLRPTPCQLSDLHVDIVLVSHNHFDHLDERVVFALNNTVRWVVPLGLRDWFARRGVYKVIELDWWQEHTFQGNSSFTVTATPLQHWSGRSLFDVNQSLWCGFVVKGPSSSFFHCGDTGYCTAFKEIGRRLGPITLATIPIGSYAPRWYMEHQHIDPDDAAKIHKDIGAQLSVGVHWGTFLMSDEHYMEPPKRLKQAAEDHKLGDSFITLPLGETRVIASSLSENVTFHSSVAVIPEDHPSGATTPDALLSESYHHLTAWTS